MDYIKLFEDFYDDEDDEELYSKSGNRIIVPSPMMLKNLQDLEWTEETPEELSYVIKSDTSVVRIAVLDSEFGAEDDDEVAEHQDVYVARAVKKNDGSFYAELIYPPEFVARLKFSLEDEAMEQISKWTGYQCPALVDVSSLTHFSAKREQRGAAEDAYFSRSGSIGSKEDGSGDPAAFDYSTISKN